MAQIGIQMENGFAPFGGGGTSDINAGTGLTKNGSTINHSNAITAGRVGTSVDTSGPVIAIPYVDYDAQGHITDKGTHEHIIPTMIGATTTSTGVSGLPIAPSAGDQDKYFKGDGTWTEIPLLTLDNGIIYDPPITIIPPNADDPNVKINNISQFILTNIGTTQQVGFQGDESGNIYVQAGSFIDNSDPNIKETGTLIYSAHTTGVMHTNYVYAAHVGNVMNYILYMTKGSEYGSDSGLFPDTATLVHSNYEVTDLNSSIMNKGFYSAEGYGFEYECTGRNYSGHYGTYMIKSTDSCAVWW